MAVPERTERKEEGSGRWSSPPPYLGLGLGLAVNAVMVVVTTGGHLAVGSKKGTLFYSLAGRGDPEPEGPAER